MLFKFFYPFLDNTLKLQLQQRWELTLYSGHFRLFYEHVIRKFYARRHGTERMPAEKLTCEEENKKSKLDFLFRRFCRIFLLVQWGKKETNIKFWRLCYIVFIIIIVYSISVPYKIMSLLRLKWEISVKCWIKKR